MRIMLLSGFFNYGKRGILDITHKRLFAIYSFKKLFQTYGFKVEKIRGFGPPIRDIISSQHPYSWIDTVLSFLAKIMPEFFSYSFLIIAERLPSLDEVYKATIESENKQD